MVSNLILRGYGVDSHIITRGFGPITVTITGPTPSGGGGTITVIQEAIVVAEFKIKIRHLQPFVRYFSIKVHHIEILEKLPVKIKRVILDMSAKVMPFTLRSFIKGLSLNIRDSSIKIDEDKS